MQPEKETQMTVRTLSDRQQLKLKRSQAELNGGLIKVSFTFAGKEHVQTHRLSPAEMEEQRKLLREHGPDAFTTATLRMTIWGASKLGEHAVTEAFKDYARKHWTPPENPLTTQEVVAAMAAKQGLQLNAEQLLESKNLTPEARNVVLKFLDLPETAVPENELPGQVECGGKSE
jgi:hypothetical protein